MTVQKQWLPWLLVLYAATLHLVFVVAVPDPIVHPDSISYVRPALNQLTGGPFALNPERTPAYPFFLYAVLKAAKSLQAVVGIQHLIALLTAGCVGWIARRHLRLSNPVAICVAAGVALLPLGVVSAHSVLTETLYALWCWLTLGCLLSLADRPRGMTAVALGLTCAMALLTRPAGWALAVTVGASLLWIFKAHPKREWKFPGYAVITFLIALLPLLGFNYARHHFFGLTRFGGLSLFGSTARYLPIEKIEDSTLRQALQPYYAGEKPKESLMDANWVRYSPEGPVAQLRRIMASPNELDATLHRLAWRAIGHQPFTFVWHQAGEFIAFLWDRHRVPPIYGSPEYSFFIHRGLLMLRSAFPEGGILDRLPATSAQQNRRYLDTLVQIRNLKDRQAAAAIEMARTEDPYQYERVLEVWTPVHWIFPLLGWLPLAGGLAGLSLLRLRTRRSVASLLLLYIAMHIVVTNLGGDRDARHAVPLEPAYVLLLALAASEYRAVRSRR